ncbi:serine-rich protein [Spatholobus suberectus]|nr:serine-rich protein [Spatholobus suberectus]
MASSSSRTKSSGQVLRSLSPSSSFCSYSTSNAPFHSPSSSFFNKPHSHAPHRATSPTRVNLYSAAPLPSPSVRFSLDRSISPNRTVSSHVVAKNRHVTVQKRTCTCSPTTHPGSFRCSLHKNHRHTPAGSFPSNRLNIMRRSAMKNSLVRIGGVEGEWVKRALTALIRPSSHQQRRRSAFEPRLSRLSIMSKTQE